MQYTFKEFDEDIHYLVKQVEQSNKSYDYIIGIKRGGLIPAVCLSHALNIPLHILEWSNRDSVKWELDNSAMRIGKRILLVDDICDSGETLIKIKEHYSHCHIDTAVLLFNEDQIHIPTYYAHAFSRKEQPEFYDFWWELYK
jgi:hypoxanthine phosphoribosyltransferase